MLLQHHQISESFRFENENEYVYEIWLKFLRVLKKRHPGKLEKVGTVIYTEGG